METTFRYLILVSCAFLMFNCSDELYDAPKGYVIASSESVKVGDRVNFNWSGNGSQIVFFSGENGHKYEDRDKTILVGATAIPEVTFSYGDAKRVNWDRGWLDFYYSLNYDPNAEFDKNDWVNISDDFGSVGLGLHDPTKGGQGIATATTGYLPLKNLGGKRVTFAFRACAVYKAFGVDLTWTNFKVRVHIPDLQIRIDMPNITKYESVYYEPSVLDYSYEWIVNGANMRFVNKAGTKNVLEEQFGWCILPTQSFEFTEGVPYSGDSGTVVKTTSQKDTSWSYVYTKPGVYTTTTVVSTYDPRSDKVNTVTDERTITVVE